jgi:hypothetical protein
MSEGSFEQMPFGDATFAENPENRCTVVLLLDTSGSMAGQRIQELNAGLQTFRDELFSDSLASKRVDVAIVTFGPVKVECDFTGIQSFIAPHLTTTGDTPMGAAVEKALEMVRERIHAANSAPRPAKEIKAKVRAEVEALAARGAPGLYELLEGGNAIAWPMLQVLSRVETNQGPGIATAETPDALALICWSFKSQLLSALDAEIERCADDGAAMTADQKATKIGELEAALLERERVEEAITAAVIECGSKVARRADLDPRALMGVDGPAPAK